MFEQYIWENNIEIDQILRNTLIEDIGKGDLTSKLLIIEDQPIDFVVASREPIIICGIYLAERICELWNSKNNLTLHVKDGEQLKTSSVLISGKMPSKDLFAIERSMLNILQHLSGVASLTNRYVQAVDGTGVIILDTRKTLPNLRILQKYAVKIGGGQNHRMRLDDGVLIKDNHIAAVGSITKAIQLARARISHLQKIEIECDNLEQVEEATEAGVDVVMLDNMNIMELQEAVKLVNGRATVEASGGINLDNVREVALTGVNYISIGRLTHSAAAVDIGLDIVSSLK